MAAQVAPSAVKEMDRYRLILFNKAGTCVLVSRGDSRAQLPTVKLPKFARLAREFTQLLRDSWGLSAVFLFSSEINGKSGTMQCVVGEAHDELWSPTGNLSWIPVDHAVSLPLHSADAHFLTLALSRVADDDLHDESQPFARLGWLDELQEYVESILQPRGIDVTGFEQINGSESFSLIRFDTTELPVWFKAVGEPLLAEYSITFGLADYFPRFLPKILGVRSKWHGWLMEDSGGSRLDASNDLRLWKLAASSLAQMQLASLSRIDELHALGCQRRTAAELPKLIAGYIQMMRELMPRQPFTPPPILTNAELTDLGLALVECCEQLDRNPITPALVHGDFKGGNIQASESRCVFIDWAQALISYPFANLEHLLVLLPKGLPERRVWRQSLIDNYMAHWHDHFSEDALQDAFRLMPVFAPVLRILPEFGEYEPAQIDDSEFGKYMRSMTRRLWRESLALEVTPT